MSYKIKIISRNKNQPYFNSIIKKSKKLYIDGFNGNYFDEITFPSNFIICVFDLLNSDKLIGIAGLTIDVLGEYSIKKCANFNSFTIHHNYRKCGIGHLMIKYLKKYLKLLNIETIVLSVEYVNAKENHKLINYYKKNGFSIFIPEKNIITKQKYINPKNNYFFENNETCMKCKL